MAMTPKVMTVVLATHNPGKIAELRALLAHLPIELVSVDQVLPSFAPPNETGATFEENAVLKARAIAEATQLVALADDSGLEVDALGGRPGVRSARFAGEGATDSENNAALLSALELVEDADRTARFRCVMALVDPFLEGDKPIVADGKCEGTIARDPRGESGFGYDPLFIVSGASRTFGELGTVEKSGLSHRAKAVAAIVPRVEAIVEARLAEAFRILASSAKAKAGTDGGPQ